MLKSLYTSATGMKAQQTMVDMIANNIANVNTSGFKKSQASFEDLFYVTLQSPGLARGTNGDAVPIGTQIYDAAGITPPAPSYGGHGYYFDGGAPMQSDEAYPGGEMLQQIHVLRTQLRRQLLRPGLLPGVVAREHDQPFGSALPQLARFLHNVDAITHSKVCSRAPASPVSLSGARCS